MAPGFLGHPTQRRQARGVGGKGRHQHPAGLARLDDLQQAFADIGFAARGLVIEDIGRIADHRQYAGITDGGELCRRGRGAEQRAIIELPVAGVENPAIGRIDDQRIAFGDRVRQRDIAEVEVAKGQFAIHRDDVELDLLGQPFFLELLGDQTSSERRRIKRHAEFVGEIGDRADMVFMAMGEHDAEQIGAAFLDEGQIGQHEFDPGIARIGKGHAEIDHHPFAVAAIEIDVHADFARAAQRQENQFVTWFHLNLCSFLVRFALN